jgi:hypothetical protein
MSEEVKLIGKPHDLGGGMTVTRLIPQAQKRMIGPFVFFDHMGPVDIKAGQNIDVRPHPHIGLSTLTYLLEGRMVHRDSLGTEVTINPGDVNWMTAGRGISHSERAHIDDKKREHRLQGLQLWVALTDELEDVAPSFDHYDSSEIPRLETTAYRLSVVAGEAFGLKSAVRTSSPLILAAVQAKSDGVFDVEFKEFEVGVYVVAGQVELLGQTLLAHELLVLAPEVFARIKFDTTAHFVILGGPPFGSPRFIWWNMVSGSREKIEMAKYQWKNGTFPMVPGDSEFIPAPD